jgi:membrane protein DedA with SNARE-associated domain
LTRTLLAWLIENGPITLALVAFICALGIPLPIPVLVIGAGALIRQGHMGLYTAVMVTSFSALLAETLYFAIGRELGPRSRARLGARYASLYDETERRFNQHPDLTVFLTRWLIAPLGIPTNLIAGAAGFPLSRFALASILGNLMWILAYTAVGYALGSQWESVSPVIDRYKVWFAGAAIVIGIAIVAFRNRQMLLRASRNALAGVAPEHPAAEPAKVRVPDKERKH